MGYMNTEVFAPLGIPSRGGGQAACIPPPSGLSDQILSYPFPPDDAHGTDWSNEPRDCGGSDWNLSAGDLFKVINDLANGNVLLSDSQKALMGNTTGQKQRAVLGNMNCLGWDCAVRSDCPDPYVCKNGTQFEPSGIEVHTYAGIFNCTVPVVVIVNSYLPSPYQELDTSGNQITNRGDIIGLVNDAYQASGVAGKPITCIHGFLGPSPG